MGSVVPVVVVHGGAGEVAEASRDRHRLGCARAAEAALLVLLSSGSALDAAQRAVEILEDDPLFNAGTGACLTRDGELELDAAIMEGTTLRAGCVAALPPFKNPIAIARAVLDRGKVVFYAAEGASAFARGAGFVPASSESMLTAASSDRLALVLRGEGKGGWAGGTVGAVACDASGHLAAATSTGGLVGKDRGRIGDSPVLGAGTYADDLSAAVSATGDGEAALRLGLSRLACELVRGGMPAMAAAEAAIAQFGARVAGEGGLILVSPRGEVGLAWNSTTMTHAIARAGEPVRSGILERA